MAEKLTSQTGHTAPAGTDLIYVVDVSDFTDGATGTSKKMTLTTLGEWIEQTYIGAYSPTVVGSVITVSPLGLIPSSVGANDDDYLRADGTWASIPSTGESNTASNVGTGVSLFKQKSGLDLEFNSIKSENTRLSIALDAGSNDIELTVVEANIVHQNLSGAGTLTHSSIDSILTGFTTAGQIAGVTTSQTLTNKTIDSASNTITNIDTGDFNSTLITALSTTAIVSANDTIMFWSASGGNFYKRTIDSLFADVNITTTGALASVEIEGDLQIDQPSSSTGLILEYAGTNADIFQDSSNHLNLRPGGIGKVRISDSYKLASGPGSFGTDTQPLPLATKLTDTADTAFIRTPVTINYSLTASQWENSDIVTILDIDSYDSLGAFFVLDARIYISKAGASNTFALNTGPVLYYSDSDFASEIICGFTDDASLSAAPGMNTTGWYDGVLTKGAQPFGGAGAQIIPDQASISIMGGSVNFISGVTAGAVGTDVMLVVTYIHIPNSEILA